MLILQISACGRDDDDTTPSREVMVTYEVAAIGSASEASGQLDLCDRGRYLQIADSVMMASFIIPGTSAIR